MKPFYSYAKLSEPCKCGSAHPYRECCFRSYLVGIIVAFVILAALLLLPSGSWLYRIVRAGFGLLTWVCIFAMLREWFLKRRAKKREDDHVA